MYNYAILERGFDMKNIVIIPNDSKDNNFLVTKKLISALYGDAQLYMDKKFSCIGDKIKYLDGEELYDNADFVIVLGGDGTILEAAVHCGMRNIPIMGINLGKVGFMTEIDVNDIESACRALLSGDFKIEKRMMMNVCVKNKNGCTNYCALNDVVISKFESSMILINVHSEDEKINEYRADGLIIATPTGSTGYSLSAGGPVADPTMELFIASPICAHELHARPALMPADKQLSITISDELGHSALITLDGREVKKIRLGDEVTVTKSEYYTDIVKIKNQSFYDVLTKKLK